MTDPFEGTVYRDLVNADDAVQLARFHGVQGGICYEPATAIEQIDRAVTALQSARRRLTEVAAQGDAHMLTV